MIWQPGSAPSPKNPPRPKVPDGGASDVPTRQSPRPRSRDAEIGDGIHVEHEGDDVALFVAMGADTVEDATRRVNSDVVSGWPDRSTRSRR